MRKNITLVCLSNSGSKVRQITASVKSIRICLAVAFLVLGFLTYDYCRLKTEAIHTPGLERTVAGQQETIISQRKQIQEFAGEITSLKDRIAAVDDFQKKIRVIANIDDSDEQENLLGVGGSMPEDLDTRIPLTEKHNSLIREMHEQVQQLSAMSTSQEKGLETLLNYLQDQQNLLASTPSIRPVEGGWISSRFGRRKSPFTGRTEFHKGYDIAAKPGTPILATADGRVSYAGRRGLMGNMIAINHGHGLVTYYGHAEKLLKKRGDRVKRGEKIALMGNTGRSTGPHVHYQVLLDGIPVNPEDYILN